MVDTIPTSAGSCRQLVPPMRTNRTPSGSERVRVCMSENWCRHLKTSTRAPTRSFFNHSTAMENIIDDGSVKH
ncbi:hypothetical protein KIN20_029966 [Parelaphostrongylus tenuis]|uniref:Uncharacterized protein n=1 Tax=Parelaphostrongylus tenuis TaxID=148309 RepID=A0AAD5R3B3_PARTN|nr:hypothetical protein KIN20_029966 [Parelaphostrongylus tenuis]